MKASAGSESEPFIVTARREEAEATTTISVDKESEKSFGGYLGNIVAFVLLTVQTAIVVLTMRYSRIEHASSSISDEPTFAITAAVMFAEIGKCIIGILVTLYDINVSPESKKEGKSMFVVLYNEIFNDWRVVMKMSVPAILYAIQNNLLFTALSNLDSAFYQILYQLKTFTAAILAVIMLKRVYTKYQWLSFLCLAVGAILANLSVIQDNDIENNGNPLIGIICVLCATLTSGFCGVYMEKELKGSKQSLYIKNIQLGMFGALACIINSYFVGDLQNIFIPYGITHGFTKIAWFVVIMNIFGGYLVAWIIKYIENIAKAFASTTALILIVIASYYIFNTQLTSVFAAGFILVLCGNILFNHKVLWK